MRKREIISKIFGIALVFAMLGSMVGVLPLLAREAEASPGTIYVPDDYAKIQWAVDAANLGDTIIVRDGNYTEKLTVNKRVTLLGENVENATVVGGFKVTADNVTIQNFTITEGYDWDPDGSGLGGAYRAGIYVASCDNVRIFNNRMENIQGGTGGTGAKYGSGGAGGVGAGIYLSSSTGGNLTSNNVENVQGGTGGIAGDFGQGGAGGVGAGIYLSSSTGNKLTSNGIVNILGGSGGAGVGYKRTAGANQVGFGIYLDENSENNYLGVSGSEFNTLDGDPILYFYDMTGLVIENFTLSANCNPTNYGKIALISCTSCTVQNNIIGNYIGMSGGTGGWEGSGGAGGIGVGVYLSSSAGNNLTSNTIENIEGGTGGTGGGNGGSAGAGGIGAGIYLSSSTGGNLTSNAIKNIQGGKGGRGAYWGSGGAGGVSAGIYFSSSTGNNLICNTIENILGGAGGGGGASGARGAGQVGFGIYLDENSENNYLGVSESEFNTLDGDPILYFYDMTGLVIENYTLTADCNPTNYGKVALISCTSCTVQNNIIGNYTGISGSTGECWDSGDPGGVGAGIYLSSSSGNNLTSNTIDTIQGGTGGTGGSSGSGGAGGIGAGVCLSSSTGNNLTANTIENIQGGHGGHGAYANSGGVGGVGTGIYLSSSTGDYLTSNTIENIQGGSGGSAGGCGSGGAGQVGFGIYLDENSENNYLGVSESEFNTLDGDPILYFYDMNGLVIENYALTANSNPTNYGKIALIGCTNCTVEDNTIGNYTGMSGNTGARYGGDAGGVGAGIYISSSTGNSLTSNAIGNIQGGTGGSAGRYGSGGVGGVGTGIYLSSSTGDNLTSNTIENIQGGSGGNGSTGPEGVGRGIYLGDSGNNTLTNNTASNSDFGIYLSSSSNNNLTDNAMSGNTYNFGVEGDNLTHYIQNIDTSNKVDGKPIYYWVDQQDQQVPNDAGFVGIVSSTNITARDLILTKNEEGVLFAYTENSRIENVTVSNNYYGIRLLDSSNNTLTENTAENNSRGIHVENSSDNLIYNNYFDNTSNAWDNGNNIWNISKTEGTNIIGGPYLGGNYWSDYAGEDTDGDGLGDTETPYNCSGNIQSGGDYLPLVEVQERVFDMQLKAGWNMVSLPVDPGTSNPDEIFSDVGTYYLYTWNATDKKYVIPTEITSGKGYWMLVFGDATQTMHGTAIDEYSLSGNAGWHMMGSLSVEAQVEVSSGDVYNLFYTWDATDKKYVLSSSLEPGRGYWLLAFTDFSAVVIPMPAP